MPEPSGTISSEHGTTTFTGDAVLIYQARVVTQGLKACLRLNRAYTPTRLLATASSLTENTYKRGQYDLAIEDLEEWIDRHLESVVIS